MWALCGEHSRLLGPPVRTAGLVRASGYLLRFGQGIDNIESIEVYEKWLKNGRALRLGLALHWGV